MKVSTLAKAAGAAILSLGLITSPMTLPSIAQETELGQDVESELQVTEEALDSTAQDLQATEFEDEDSFDWGWLGLFGLLGLLGLRGRKHDTVTTTPYRETDRVGTTGTTGPTDYRR